ncbi:MAG: polysaccharide deacetylase family protein [Ruegeria sp.]
MKIDWSPLRTALAACRRDGVSVPLWWRDDDAVDHTPALDRLLNLSARLGLPVHLAIIPAHAAPALAKLVAGSNMIPVVHGWAHTDHSAPDEKKNEFQTGRPGMADDSARALTRMTDLFGDHLCPMFVPPWNRVSDALVQNLPDQGYTALSTYGPRKVQDPAPGLVAINTHVDPIWWKGTRDLVSPEALVSLAAAHLTARRIGDEDAAEPFGLLTHHLVHTPAIWSFTSDFVSEMLAGGATPWKMENTE